MENLNPISPIDNKNLLPKVILKPSNGYSIPKNMEDNLQKVRPLKLVYEHDMRRADLPVNSTFKILRAVVRKVFPTLKAVLIKYKDSDGDLMTITCSSELRLAESEASSLSVLRLYIVEVNPEEEPPVLEDEEEDEPESKVVEMDDWVLDFAKIFTTRGGIDPDKDLNKVGMERLSKAVTETVSCEEAQTLFDKANSKFEHVAALAFFSWGNVHMCEAQTRMQTIDEAETMDDEQLKNAYDWVREKHKMAKTKYKMALLNKPDFFEGLLALGQLQFERAKLLWSFVSANKSDLSKWDPTKMILLFDSAETNMRAATEMWEKKMEEQRANEESKQDQKDEVLKKWKKKVELTPEEAAEQAEVMTSQIHLIWGYMLFDRSQVEHFLGLSGWDKNLDAAVERFKLAGVFYGDIVNDLRKYNGGIIKKKGMKVEEVIVSTEK